MGRKNKPIRKTKIMCRILAQVMLTLFLAFAIAPIFAMNISKEGTNITTKESTPPETIETTYETETNTQATEPTEVTEEYATTSPIEKPIQNEAPSQVIQKPHVKPIDNRKGLIGRLLIPSVGINLALREPSNDSEAQAFVDEKDSAAIFWRGEARIIADHNNQGFAYLSKVSIGDKAEVQFKDGTCVSYIVVNKFTGHNTGPELTDEEYNCIYDDNIGGLTLYTCYAGWENIWVVYLQPI